MLKDGYEAMRLAFGTEQGSATTAGTVRLIENSLLEVDRTCDALSS